jgi:tetratricopeptide (TPR) repeat protein
VPDNSFALYNRGITKDRMGDFSGAVTDFMAAIALDPNNPDFYHNRGFSLRKQGKFEAAIGDYTRAIELNPSHCRAYYNRAFSHDRLGSFENAVSDYTRALDIEPGNPAALHNRGSLYERLGRCVCLLSSVDMPLLLWVGRVCNKHGTHACLHYDITPVVDQNLVYLHRQAPRCALRL